jgi:hypothetical protein
MAPQEQPDQRVENLEPYVGPLTKIPSLGFVRRKRATSSDAWRNTLRQHVPEPWPAARMSLQVRIAALDIEA